MLALFAVVLLLAGSLLATCHAESRKGANYNSAGEGGAERLALSAQPALQGTRSCRCRCGCSCFLLQDGSGGPRAVVPAALLPPPSQQACPPVTASCWPPRALVRRRAG